MSICFYSFLGVGTKVEVMKENGQEPKGVFLFLLDSGFISVADDANFT